MGAVAVVPARWATNAVAAGCSKMGRLLEYPTRLGQRILLGGDAQDHFLFCN